MEIKKVTVAGSGVLGSQIAFQTAFKGFQTNVWLRSDASIERAKPFFQRWRDTYIQELELAKLHVLGKSAPMPVAGGIFSDITKVSIEEIDEKIEFVKTLPEKITFSTDMAEAFKDTDLVIEAVAENIEQKKDFYEKLAPHLQDHTILCTNSSTLLPSMFAEETKRPEKFLALHFANLIWRSNTGEIMGHENTSKEAFDTVVQFAKDIGMVALPLHKEQAGYLLNSLLVPFLSAATDLWAMDVADPETIDLTWKVGTGAPRGPFEIIDIVGLTTVYNIKSMNPLSKDPETAQGKTVAKLKAMIDAGKKGRNVGEGFYKY
ncbi:MAG: 3-hydroxyacyl-CoA dehydrogenase [Tissierellia bacterium]|nr:3-hydroxyacyl-CoA dehydrogenase [Tissierellia bacterium]